MIRQSAIALGMRIIGTGFWLLYTVAMAQWMTAEQFGTVMYAINLALVLAPVATLGFESSTLKHASTYWEDGHKAAFAGMLGTARKMAMLGGGIFCSVLMLGAALGVDNPVTDNIVIAALTGLCVLLAALMGIHRDSLRAADKLVPAFLGLSIFRTLGPLVAAGLLYLSDMLTIQTALVTFALSLGFAISVEFWMMLRLRLPKPALTKDQMTAHLRVAKGTWVGDMAHVILMRGPTLCLGFLVAPQTLALFLAAERIANLGQFLTDAVRTAAAPNLARAFKNTDDTSTMAEALSQVSRLMLKSGFADAALLCVIAYPALWAMGPEFLQAFPLVGLFIIVQLGWTIPGPTAMVLNMSGLEKRRTLWTVLAALVLVAAIIGLVPLTAAWVALAVQAVVIWALNLWQVFQIHRDRGVWSGIFAVRGGSS